MKYAGLFTVMVLLLTPTANAGKEMEEMKPYPAAEEGLTRMVFRLPTVENEEDRKVEIVVGKTLEVDCNLTWFRGNLEKRVAEGWGYPYFVLEKVGAPSTTLMACPPGEEKTEAFVGVRGDGFLQRYNSKLPVVTYVPEGFEVRYRIWAVGDEIGRADPK